VYEQSEIISLLATLVLAPVAYANMRDIDLAGKRWWYAGFLFLSSSYVTTILEGYAFPNLFNLLEHWGYVGAGICFAYGCWQLLRSRLASGVDAT
jgi:hypothetical protein